MKIFSENEWDTLRRVIVGTADHANFPVSDTVFSHTIEQAPWTETDFPYGPVDHSVIDRANQSLDELSAQLQNLSIEVFRPLPRNYQQLDQFYGYCPRDTVLIVGDKIIRTPTVFPSRRNEWETFLHVWQSCSVIYPDDPAAKFDAANVCRLGRDLLYLVSPTGNTAGAHWLQDFLGKEYRVHILDNLYSGVHIDSTIVPLREGLVMLNADRVTEDTVPEPLKSWDKIWIHRDEIINKNFYQYPYASNWIAMNILSVNPNLTIVDPDQKIIKEKLHNYGIETVDIDLTESRTLGGGHHCVTLDIFRS